LSTKKISTQTISIVRTFHDAGTYPCRLCWFDLSGFAEVGPDELERKSVALVSMNTICGVPRQARYAATFDGIVFRYRLPPASSRF
jgi:hypothetical protein